MATLVPKIGISQGFQFKRNDILSLHSLGIPVLQGGANLSLIFKSATASIFNQTSFSNTDNSFGFYARTSTRLLGGTALSSSGVAANAFDGNVNTSCAQDASYGWIGYDFGESNEQEVEIVGVRSFNENQLTLNIETSPNGDSWTIIKSLAITSYTAGQVIWTNIETPSEARFYRIREIGDATLNISELYFNNNIVDTQVSDLNNGQNFFDIVPSTTLQFRAIDPPPAVSILDNHDIYMKMDGSDPTGGDENCVFGLYINYDILQITE